MAKKVSCVGCGMVLPFTEDYFEKYGGKNQNRLRKLCKNCIAIREEMLRKSAAKEQRVKEIVRPDVPPEKKMHDKVERFNHTPYTRCGIADVPELLIGLGTDDLCKYLAHTFKVIYGYEWDGTEETEIDHIYPLSKAKDEDEMKKLWHYTNLRLLRKQDNQNKGAHTRYEIKT